MNEAGRIAADGTVYVAMPDGTERPVGQWAAGNPAAGLAHYRRRYEDLVLEVDLTAQRLRNGNASPDQVDVVVAKLRGAAENPVFVGDIAALLAKVDTLEEASGRRREELAEERKRLREETLGKRAAIADEAEQVAAAGQWKAGAQRFRELLDEWKSLPRFDKALEQEHWSRFSAARSDFDRKRRQHFAELDAAHAEAAKIKELLVRRAEELSPSTDWATTSRAYRDLMTEWKAAPRAGRVADDELWQRFRAAQDRFFDARNQVHAERAGEESRNLAAKEELLRKAEALVPATDYREARAELSRLMDEWERIGFVPRDQKASLERRLRAVESRIRAAEQDHWRRSDPAARDRAERTVESFRRSVANLERQLEEARTTGDQRKIADLERSLDSTLALLAAAEGAASEFVSD